MSRNQLQDDPDVGIISNLKKNFFNEQHFSDLLNKIRQTNMYNWSLRQREESKNREEKKIVEQIITIHFSNHT